MEFLISLRENGVLFLYSVIGLAGVFMIACTVLETRRSIWKFVCFSLLKGFYTLIFTTAITDRVAGAEYLAVFNSLIFPILGYVLVLWFFKGSFIKRLLVFSAAEMISALIYFTALSLASMIMPGRTWFAVFLCLAAYGVFYLCVRPWLLRIRHVAFEACKTWQKNLFAFLAAMYLITCVYSYLLDFKSMAQYTLQCCILLGICIAAVGIPSGLFFWHIRRQACLEKEYLCVQKNLIETRYALMKRDESGDYDRMLHEMDEQMKQLIRMEESEQSSERIKSYLTHLKKEYASIRTGIYSDDPLTDAVLCYQADRLKKQGIAFSCHRQGRVKSRDETKDGSIAESKSKAEERIMAEDRNAATGRIEAEDRFQILLQLLDWAAETAQNPRGDETPEASAVSEASAAPKAEVTLEMKEISSRWVVRVSVKGTEKLRRPRKPGWMKPYLKKYQGMMQLERGETHAELMIGLALDAGS
ncbi:MAG: hypothetical protein LUI13_00530 [Lachnospiraceae bacterium]|nr:hypothetical protein [Lachnospiraceae bacterium]